MSASCIACGIESSTYAIKASTAARCWECEATYWARKYNDLTVFIRVEIEHAEGRQKRAGELRYWSLVERIGGRIDALKELLAVIENDASFSK